MCALCKQLAVRFHVAAGLSALQRLVLSDCLLMEQEPLAEIPDQLVSRTLGCELGFGALGNSTPLLCNPVSQAVSLTQGLGG